MTLALFSGCGANLVPQPSPSSAPPPPWSTEFARDDGLFDRVVSSGGSVTYGVADSRASDGFAAALLLPGDPRLAPTDHAGPHFATEIDSRRLFRYGVFRTRIRLARCQPDEEVVSGIFTFFNDGSDGNGNGIPDNSELDIEIFCGTPSVFSLSSWTDYSDDRFIKRTRVVDLASGAYSETPSDRRYDLVPMGTLAGVAHPGFPDPDTYYEMGFEWHPTRVRFFIVLDGQELTLWDMNDARDVPQRPAYLLFDVWHRKEHWFGPAGGSQAQYPSRDAEMRIDWVTHHEE